MAISATRAFRSTTEPLRLEYDAANYVSFGVGSTGDLTITPGGGYVTVSGAATVSGASTLTGSVSMGATKHYVNDSANSNMTVGLTLNQGANDDEILALKSSDVAHGMTGLTETDTFLYAKKRSGAYGGVVLAGLTEYEVGLQADGFATLNNTTKTTAGLGAVVLQATLRSGTSVTNMGADANLAVIRNNGTTRFIFDAEGSAHADIEWTVF